VIINITGRQSQQGQKVAEMSNSLTCGLYGKLLPTSFSTAEQHFSCSAEITTPGTTIKSHKKLAE